MDDGQGILGGLYSSFHPCPAKTACQDYSFKIGSIGVRWGNIYSPPHSRILIINKQVI